MSIGFFGKLPASGDFLARGLQPGAQPFLDRWITRHLADPARTPDAWPSGGVMAYLDAPTGPLTLLILPSQDAAGRHYPLAICASVSGSTQFSIEAWSTDIHPIAIEAIQEKWKADTLQAQLAQSAPPATSENPMPTPALWADGTGTDPSQTLRTLFSYS